MGKKCGKQKEKVSMRQFSRKTQRDGNLGELHVDGRVILY
jgi:hypothetical protein